MNKVFLIGRLTKDPELKSTTNGKLACQFTIAVNRQYTNANGEREADFINCVVWNAQAENLVKYQRKGNQIAVEGRIQVRSYDNEEGKKVYITEILVENINYLDSKSNNTQTAANYAETAVNSAPATSQTSSQSSSQSVDPYQAFGDSIEISDNDLPF